MKKANWLVGVALGAAAAMTGCAGADTTAGAAELDQSAVLGTVDGRTDLFLDPMLSAHLLTADEVNGSPTAVAVEVQLTENELIAWRAQPGVDAAHRSRTEADIVGRFQVVETVDLSTAQTIGNETHPGTGQTVVIPGGPLGGFRGGRNGGGVSVTPPSHIPSLTGFIINWGRNGAIPGDTDSTLLDGLRGAHPGCA